jgi:hypothetical protein
VPLESLPGHCDLLDSGHWQDMLTGKHDLLCKQQPLLQCKLRPAAYAYTARHPAGASQAAGSAGPHTEQMGTVDHISSPP